MHLRTQSQHNIIAEQSTLRSRAEAQEYPSKNTVRTGDPFDQSLHIFWEFIGPTVLVRAVDVLDDQRSNVQCSNAQQGNGRH